MCLSGDVMTGRGIDQVLPRPCDPELHEIRVRDARYYIHAAEALHGPVRRPAPYPWPWGSALPAIDAADPAARVINLETSITCRSTFLPGKGIHYRMSPENLPAVLAVRPDVCVLANNHVLDFGRPGLLDTLDALASAGIRVAGAGRDRAEAARPAVVPLRGGGRLVVFAAGTPSSGVPLDWAATATRPGVDVLPDLSADAAAALVERVAAVKRPGDVVMLSVHWGSNWGYRVPGEQVEFAHRVVDGGVDVLHGHSSHHPRPVEVYRGRLVLYGCGDLINDYEGIAGMEEYRDELRLLYFATVDDTGTLVRLRMAPWRARRFRLEPADEDDTAWLADTLTRASARFGTRVVVTSDGGLAATVTPR